MKLLLLTVLGLSTSTVIAKNQYVVKEERQVKTPKVKAYDTTMCLFDNGKDHFCVDNAVQLEAGQVWDQDYTTLTGTTNKYYKLRYNLYATASGSLHPELVIEKYYSGEITAAFDPFTYKLFGELMYTDDKYLCLNAGYKTDKIALDVTTQVSFKDCYKKVLNTFTDPGNWLTTTGNWYDECTDSNDEEITLYKWSPVLVAKEDYW